MLSQIDRFNQRHDWKNMEGLHLIINNVIGCERFSLQTLRILIWIE